MFTPTRAQFKGRKKMSTNQRLLIRQYCAKKEWKRKKEKGRMDEERKSERRREKGQDKMRLMRELKRSLIIYTNGQSTTPQK